MSLSEQARRRLEALELLSTDEPRLTVALPFKVLSRANDHTSNHWSSRAKTSKAHRQGATLALSAYRRQLRAMLDSTGLVVRVVRIAPRELDSHDNLGMALKAITDGVADALAVNDRDQRVAFVPDAERGPWGARVEFYEGDR